jgi:2-methylcitrate dehydratase PrpD
MLEISIKPWPSGRASHATLSVLDGFNAADLVGIRAEVPPLIARLVGRPWASDMNPAYARLCLPFLVAVMLSDGLIDPRRFTSANFADVALQALGARLSIIVDGNPDPNALAPQRIVLSMSDGSERAVEVPATLGSPGNPLTPSRHRAKLDLARSLAVVPLVETDPLTLLTGTAP